MTYSIAAVVKYKWQFNLLNLGKNSEGSNYSNDDDQDKVYSLHSQFWLIYLLWLHVGQDKEGWQWVSWVYRRVHTYNNHEIFFPAKMPRLISPCASSELWLWLLEAMKYFSVSSHIFPALDMTERDWGFIWIFNSHTLSFLLSVQDSEREVMTVGRIRS